MVKEWAERGCPVRGGATNAHSPLATNVNDDTLPEAVWARAQCGGAIAPFIMIRKL
jgi:hypothetical protein